MKLLITESQYKILIKEFMGTIDADKFINFLNKFSSDNNINAVIYKSETNVFYDFKTYDNVNYIKILKEINDFIKPYNWFISNIDLSYKDESEENFNTNMIEKIETWIKENDFPITRISIDLEKTYNENENIDNVFYHVSDIKNIEQIMTKGLYPRKSQNLLFNYPKRIYLANDVKTAYKINDIFKDPKSKKDYGKEGTVVFEIKLPLNIKTYKDPKAPNSSYIMEPVHPKYIEIYDYLK